MSSPQLTASSLLTERARKVVASRRRSKKMVPRFTSKRTFSCLFFCATAGYFVFFVGEFFVSCSLPLTRLLESCQRVAHRERCATRDDRGRERKKRVDVCFMKQARERREASPEAPLRSTTTKSKRFYEERQRDNFETPHAFFFRVPLFRIRSQSGVCSDNVKKKLQK